VGRDSFKKLHFISRVEDIINNGHLKHNPIILLEYIDGTSIQQMMIKLPLTSRSYYSDEKKLAKVRKGTFTNETIII
jgi:hypothetical protein